MITPERPAGRRIGLFTFEPGPNFRATAIPASFPRGPPKPLVDRMDVGVAQGFVEDSNVNPVLEMTRLIMVQRAFENTSALIRASRSLDQAIQTLGSK
jgi:flagellar basal-body rod protein FlgF